MTLQYKKVYIETLGCQMNKSDTERIFGILSHFGYTPCKDENEADFCIVNTCSIRQLSEDKAYSKLGVWGKIKKERPLKIAICGCVAQQEKEKLLKRFPYLDLVFGTQNIYELPDLINLEGRVCAVREKPIEEKGFNIIRAKTLNAWLPIIEGCNNFCSYCIVPYVRGRERSRNMLDIHKEVEHLVQQGYKIITLLGQNVNSYGNDIDDKNITFANLLKDLCTIPGDFRIKFMSSHPKDLTDEVIDVIATNKKMSKAVHLPVQSGSNAILKAMNRKYTIEHYLELVDKLRHKIPNCRITTDIIVGFPGETEEDFAMTYDLVKKVRYSGVFAFMYSPRKGTVAASMDHQIPQEEKNRRVNKLLALSKQIIKEQAEEFLHTRQEVLVDHKTEQGEFVGILDCGKDVILKGQNYTLGQYQNIMITDKKNNQLYGCVE